MKVRIGVACLVVLLAEGSLISFGGGGGDGSAPLSPPAFTNLAGTRWNETDTVQAGGTCTGVAPGVTSDSFILHVASQSGNALSVYDELRAGPSGAVPATISGFVVTISGNRYAIGGCPPDKMTVFAAVTLNGAGTSYSGSGTITCTEPPACSVPVTIAGTRIP